MLEHFGNLLATVPFSKTRPGITSLVIHAVSYAETALEEHDLRSAPTSPEGCITLARFHENADCCYEARAYWDLWTSEAGPARLGPQPIEILCTGDKFDDGASNEAGHFQLDLGDEEWFLNADPGAVETQKQRENARALREWLQQLRSALPIERYALWSEGEADFEARLDGALANL